MPRPKKATIELATLADCDDALRDLRDVLSEIQILTGEKNLAVAAASAKFEGDLDRAKTLKGNLETALERYYYAHLAEIEKGGAKFLQLANGRIGRRDNPESLKPLNKKWTWAGIKKALRVKFGPLYFHEPKEPEIDKDKLKAANLAAEELRQLGLKVEADETFYVEPAKMPEPGEVAG
jgi:phage host-nuclease inhibitor protein Gam